MRTIKSKDLWGFVLVLVVFNFLLNLHNLGRAFDESFEDVFVALVVWYVVAKRSVRG